MSHFFDSSSQDDLNLLHESVREHDELDHIIDKIEYEVISHYTQRRGGAMGLEEAFFATESGGDPTSEIQVRLIGYDSEEPEKSDDGLKEALRRTVAHIASEVLQSYDTDKRVQSIRQGQRSITYSASSPEQWPAGWERYLSNYDAREGLYEI